MSRRILVIYFWLLLFIINQFFGNLHLVLIFINWHSPLFFIVFRSFIKKPRMTDSKYFSTTRKGKPKFWYVQFLLFHHSFMSKYETAYVCLHTEVKKRTNKKKATGSIHIYIYEQKWPVYLCSFSLPLPFFFSFFLIVLFHIGQRNNEVSIVTFFFFFFLYGIKSSRTEVLRRYFFFSSLSFFSMRWRRRRQALFFFTYTHHRFSTLSPFF